MGAVWAQQAEAGSAAAGAGEEAEAEEEVGLADGLCPQHWFRGGD